jgi:hypothetical protein
MGADAGVFEAILAGITLSMHGRLSEKTFTTIPRNSTVGQAVTKVHEEKKVRRGPSFVFLRILGG